MSSQENNVAVDLENQYAAPTSQTGSQFEDPSGANIDESHLASVHASRPRSSPIEMVFSDENIMDLSSLVSPNNTLAATLNVLPTKTLKDKNYLRNFSFSKSNKRIFDPRRRTDMSITDNVGILSMENASKSIPSKKESHVEPNPNNILDDLSVLSENALMYNTITTNNVESALGKSYINSESIHPSSNALDVLSLYIKGQKLLYTEAKTYCEQQLNFLMLPAIFISCVGSIFSFISDKYNYGPIIIACLNGFNAFLLALISYLKLDAKAQAHKTSAYKFDKLESYCEFNSGKFMFFEPRIEDISGVVENIEKDVKEIKETNQFILPESIRYEFNFTYSTNVFMMIKRMHSREMAEIHNLKNCMNRINILKTQLDAAKIDKRDDYAKKLILELNNEKIRKEQFVNNILIRKKEYFEIDKCFKMEIDNHMSRVNKWFIVRLICCDWLKS